MSGVNLKYLKLKKLLIAATCLGGVQEYDQVLLSANCSNEFSLLISDIDDEKWNFFFL